MNDNAAIRQAIRTVAFDEALAERLGMNPTDLRCLELVIEDPGMTPGRLAELAGTHDRRGHRRARPARTRRLRRPASPIPPTAGA